MGKDATIRRFRSAQRRVGKPDLSVTHEVGCDAWQRKPCTCGAAERAKEYQQRILGEHFAAVKREMRRPRGEEKARG